MTSNDLLKNIQLQGNNVYSNRLFLEEIKQIPLFDQKFLNQVDKINCGMPTDYQETHFYNIIKDSFAFLKDIINRKSVEFNGDKIESKPIPLFGTASFNECNAFIEMNDKSTVIVFNDGLLRFVERIKEIYLKEQWLYFHKKLTPEFQRQLTCNFIDVMFCYLVSGDAYYAIPFDICGIRDFEDFLQNDNFDFSSLSSYNFEKNNEYLNFEYIIQLSTYLWIASHEYSHLILGHLNNNARSKLNLNGVSVDKITMRQQQELDADLLGAYISMTGLSPLFGEAGAIGIFIALSSLLFSDMAGKQSDTHPNAAKRMQRILNCNMFRTPKIINSIKTVDRVFFPKYKKFTEILCYINDKDISFPTLGELQKSIYWTNQFNI